MITSLVNDERPGYHGSWDAFRRLHREGHDIQSQWKTCSAKQDGHDIQARIVDREGTKFALVQAVPDRGEVVIQTPSGS